MGMQYGGQLSRWGSPSAITQPQALSWNPTWTVCTSWIGQAMWMQYGGQPGRLGSPPAVVQSWHAWDSMIPMLYVLPRCNHITMGFGGVSWWVLVATFLSIVKISITSPHLKASLMPAAHIKGKIMVRQCQRQKVCNSRKNIQMQIHGS